MQLPPSRLGGGTPILTGWGTPTPVENRWGYPSRLRLDGGTPIAEGGMPFAFTQEDFLVFFVIKIEEDILFHSVCSSFFFNTELLSDLVSY